MTAPNLISRDAAAVKAELVESFSRLVDPLLEAARSGAMLPREAERRTWAVVVQIGGMVLTAVLAVVCRRVTERAVSELGLRMFEVGVRMDRDYIAKLKTTFGPIEFPWFGFRGPDGQTHVPARSLFPLYRQARVSDLLLEWESLLASDHPFRKAASALLFFTHGAANVEDTTVERHAVLVGRSIPREWLYMTVTSIREVLRDRATIDAKSGRPIVYASTDAHALQRFVDETWAAAWKMTNGIRLWCIDRRTGAIIHLGGEFTWGDCHEVRRLFQELQRSGHLPVDGDYGEGVVAQVAFLTDGLDWIAEHVLPLYPGAVLSLDPYHVVQQVADAARVAFPGSRTRQKQLIQRARKALGIRDRRGRTVLRKGPRRVLHRSRPATSGSGQRLLEHVLRPLERLVKHGHKRLSNLIRYVASNLHRLDYGDLRSRGFQIGSGAMESLHRTASQIRLKLAGCRWTTDVAQAILNLRMLTLSGRWDEYWAQPNLTARIAMRGAH